MFLKNSIFLKKVQHYSMKKIIGIIYDEKFDECMIDGACGGSETWAIQIAKYFVRAGYAVVMFRPGSWTISNSFVEYSSQQLFKHKIETTKFEAIIFSRNIDKTRYNNILESGCTKNIYVQAHETFIWENGIYEDKFEYYDENGEERYPEIKKFIALSKFHKNALHSISNIPLDRIEIIGNGCNIDLFENFDKEHGDVNSNIENAILWSSCIPRGADILVDDILPLIKEEIPEFKVKICGYQNGDNIVPKRFLDRDDVELLGFDLTKEQYYSELRKTGVWFYPCIVAETFNIACLDAVINNCDIVSPMLHGVEHVLGPFKSFSMTYLFGTGETKDNDYAWIFKPYIVDKESDEYKKACQQAANMIVKSIKNYYDCTNIQIRKALKSYILETHTWELVVDKWKILFEKENH